MLYTLLIDLNCSCNLRCTYCNNDKKIYDYNIYNTIKSFISLNIPKIGDRVETSFKRHELFFKFRTLQNVFNRFIIDSLDKNYKLETHIVTNGTLLGKQEIQEFLYNYKHYIPSFMISLDGYKDVQDLQRPGSWNKIVENWDFLRKYTNDSIKINSVCSSKVLNIYGKSMINLIQRFKGISLIVCNFDSNIGYTEDDIDEYIKQLEIIIKYTKIYTPNIILLPVTLKTGNTLKPEVIGTTYSIQDTITQQYLYEKCSLCNNLACDTHLKPTREKEIITVHCYLFKKIEELHNKYYE
jgi:sulfatase maturation enzyme AslB (radical SAM superfamily)